MKKILMVSQMAPYLPCHDGFRLIPAHLIRCLSERHEIHLIVFVDGDETKGQLDWASKYCKSVKFLKSIYKTRGLMDRLVYNRPFSQKITCEVRSIVEAIKPDVLHLEGTLTAPLAEINMPDGKTILSAHDALYLRHKIFASFGVSMKERCQHTFWSFKFKRYEKFWFKKADHVVVTSPMDRDILSEFLMPGQVSAIPNGVDLEYFAYKPSPVPKRLVFTGNMSWFPNLDAAEYFAKDIFPQIKKEFPDAEFWIVGANPSRRVKVLAQLDGVHVTGMVPDIRDYVWNASIYVSPLRFGAGCKNKILEAMAMGAPIVATTSSLTGTPLEDGKHLLIADGKDEFISSVCRLLRDDELKNALSLKSRELVAAEYTWDSVVAQFEGIYAG